MDALADIFRATDIAKLLSGFGKGSGREDAFTHFLRGLPGPIRLQAPQEPRRVVHPRCRGPLHRARGGRHPAHEFGLPMGLADSSTVRIEVDTDNTDNCTSTGKRA
ncbi:MAG: hypothetical protein U0U25_02670 [Flavobacteriales bacterium]